MKPRMLQIMWLVKLDPKDPRLIAGDDLFHFTMFKDQMQRWRKEGVPMKREIRNSYGSIVSDRSYYGKVKWVYPLVTFGLWRDGPALNDDPFFKAAQDNAVSTFTMKDD